MALFDETRYECDVFDMILFLASEEGGKPLPNSEEKILLEMAMAVTEYLGGDTTKIIQPGQIPFCEHWWSTLNKTVGQALEQNSKRLNPALVKTLGNLLRIRWDFDHGEKWWETPIRWFLMSHQGDMGKTFFLTVPTAINVRENIVRNFDRDTVEHCKQIGILMRKYIARDLANH